MSEYAERDIVEQGSYYFRHVSAMTGEGLHYKSAIAAELAHRDIQIDALRQQLGQAQARVAELEAETEWLIATSSKPTKAATLRKQAEAVMDAKFLLGPETEARSVLRSFELRLRQQADELEAGKAGGEQ